MVLVYTKACQVVQAARRNYGARVRPLTPGEVSIVLGETCDRARLPGLQFRACARVAAYLPVEVHSGAYCTCELRASIDDLARDLDGFMVRDSEVEFVQ